MLINGDLQFPILLRPQSIGYLKLRSSSPWDKPIIDPKYTTLLLS
jgi:hypothetical protein